jgi:signal transduction histidine kinase
VTRDVTELHGRLEAFKRARLLEDERHRIARELHDRVERTFFGIGLTARAALDHADRLAECASAWIDWVGPSSLDPGRMAASWCVRSCL